MLVRMVGNMSGKVETWRRQVGRMIRRSAQKIAKIDEKVWFELAAALNQQGT